MKLPRTSTQLFLSPTFCWRLCLGTAHGIDMKDTWWARPGQKTTSVLLDHVASKLQKLSHNLWELLAKDLGNLLLDSVILLQYVDDLLISSSSYENCFKNTTKVLNHPAACGYKVSLWKAQTCWFLGMVGFCCIWIPNFGLLAKPLYDSLKGLNSEPLEWTTECQVASEALKRKLISAPALGLPNPQKPFKLYTHQKQGIGFRVFIQMLGDSPQPTANFSKKLDHITKGWPPCLWAAAAICDVLPEAGKLTLGQSITVFVRIRS